MTSEKRHSEVTGIDLSVNRHTVGDNVKGPEWTKRGFQTPDLEQIWNRWGQGPMAGGRGGPRTGTHLAQGQSPQHGARGACSLLQPGGQRGQAVPCASGRASGKFRSHVLAGSRDKAL